MSSERKKIILLEDNFVHKLAVSACSPSLVHVCSQAHSSVR